MIQLNNMLASETNTSSAGQKSSKALSKSTLDSFHGALSDAVSSKSEITRASEDVTPSRTATPNVPARTAPPTPGTPASNASPSSDSSSSAAPNGGYDPFLQAASNNPYATAPLQTSTQSSSESTAAPLTAQQAFDQAYWASQPPAVQALQNIQNPEQRAAVATQLANEGYSIDVPIMVWGWDPSVTTAMRESEGYTWVPSALQNPVEMAPGLPSMGTLTAYNPNNPPAGSIAV